MMKILNNLPRGKKKGLFLFFFKMGKMKKLTSELVGQVFSGHKGKGERWSVCSSKAR